MRRWDADVSRVFLWLLAVTFIVALIIQQLEISLLEQEIHEIEHEIGLVHE